MPIDTGLGVSGLVAYTRNDIYNGQVAGLIMAFGAAQEHGESIAFLNGVVTMARATAQAHGIPWRDIAGAARKALGDAWILEGGK